MNLEEDNPKTRKYCKAAAQDVHDQMESARELIVSSGLSRYLIDRDKELWTQIVSSMDVIEDTAQAITAYCSTEVDEEHKPLLYLVVNGLFQVLFVQQDAVKHLCEALAANDIWKRRDSVLQEIREIRNKAIGHPTKKRFGKDEVSRHGIVRVELTMEKITIWSSDPDRFYDHETYYPFVLIDKQSTAISRVMSDVLEFLEELRLKIESSDTR